MRAAPLSRVANLARVVDVGGRHHRRGIQDGSLPSGRDIGTRYGRHERWGGWPSDPAWPGSWACVNRTASRSPLAGAHRRGEIALNRRRRGRTAPPQAPSLAALGPDRHARRVKGRKPTSINIGCRPCRQRSVRLHQWRCRMAEFPPPPEGIVLAHFIVSDDVERSRRFYTEVLGGRVVFSGDVTYVALANSWIIINVGGGPTDDKPSVTLQAPRDPDRVSSFLNIRVKDIHAVYAEWSARGAQFLTPPKQHQYEIRCYIRDPDGHLIEVGQTTDPEGDWSPAHWPPSTRAGDSE